MVIKDRDLIKDRDSPTISIHALSGYSSPQTMRMTWHIKHQIVYVLIDSGSTHNLISDKLAQLLRWPTHRWSSFDVLVADGNNLECSAKCIDITIEIHEC